MSKTPDVTTLLGLLRSGWTYETIAEEYGVQRNSVWRKLQRAGKVGHKPRGVDFLPWKVAKKHRTTSIYLNLLALRRLEEGRFVNETTLGRATRMRSNLVERGLVIDYDERVKPNPAAKMGGFYYRSRKPGDGEILPPMPETPEDTDENE